MPVFHVDYKEEVKRLISETYAPADLASKEFEFTTEELVENFRRILPFKAVDADLIYEALLELNFKPQEPEPLMFTWYFTRK